jgi:SAM-dependent methyltransferase
MPPALKALVAQIAGWLIAYLLGRAGLLPPGLWALILVQALGATLCAALLRSARWWLPIHLAFTPLAVLTLRIDLAPAWYLSAFALLALIYWSSFRTQVPLYLSNRKTAVAFADLLPAGRPLQVLDIGSGTGSLLRVLARLRPDSHFTGIESAPAPWAFGWLLGRDIGNLEWCRGDFFDRSWQGQDVVYAFLSPVPMSAVWEKANREMSADSMLVSNSFAIPGHDPDCVIEVGDRRRTQLLVYRINPSKARN